MNSFSFFNSSIVFIMTGMLFACGSDLNYSIKSATFIDDGRTFYFPPETSIDFSRNYYECPYDTSPHAGRVELVVSYPELYTKTIHGTGRSYSFAHFDFSSGVVQVTTDGPSFSEAKYSKLTPPVANSRAGKEYVEALGNIQANIKWCEKPKAPFNPNPGLAPLGDYFTSIITSIQ